MRTGGAPARLRRLIDEPSRFLAVIQIVITLHRLPRLGVRRRQPHQGPGGRAGGGVLALAGVADAIALVAVTLLLALFTIVFGELVPKALALAHPERVALSLGDRSRSSAASCTRSSAS